MKAAIYCRVDQGGNAETQYDALEAQRIRLEQYALHHNIPIAGYYEDRGYPGQHLTERPGLTRLILQRKSRRWAVQRGTALNIGS